MVLRAATAALFGGLALLRGRRRALHPRGRAFSAELELGANAPGPFGPGRTVPAIVRLSRGAGLPKPLPDVHGIAIKVPSMHGPGHDQDLLLASSWLRHVLRPVLRFDAAEFSTVMPYEHAGELLVIGLLPEAADRYRMASARVGRAWGRPWGLLRLGDELPATVAEELRFHPFTTAPDLCPAGPFSDLRKPAYRASQSVRR
jgi:hypothetical protein